MADIPYPLGVGPMLEATSGGQGNFSYADTSVYGVRQARMPFIYNEHRYDSRTGLWLPNVVTPTSLLLVAGGGGGAKLPGQRKVGSRAPGFSPQGAVLIRLTKIN